MPTDLSPYLLFNGQAEQAVRLYERTLGAKLEGLSRFGDVPGSETPELHKNLVIHAALRIGDSMLMISDAMPDKPVPTESNIQVCLQFRDTEEMAAKFAALAEGGRVEMPLQDTFWGARFGMLQDRLGIHWMFNCQLDQEGAR
jgi:PhnB protein